MRVGPVRAVLDEQRVRLGVDPICRALEIAPSSHHATRSRPSRGLLPLGRRLHRTEALVLLLWRADGVDLFVPDQQVSPASIKHRLDESATRGAPLEWIEPTRRPSGSADTPPTIEMPARQPRVLTAGPSSSGPSS